MCTGVLARHLQVGTTNEGDGISINLLDVGLEDWVRSDFQE